MKMAKARGIETEIADIDIDTVTDIPIRSTERIITIIYFSRNILPSYRWGRKLIQTKKLVLISILSWKCKLDAVT